MKRNITFSAWTNGASHLRCASTQAWQHFAG
ncbi:hypothetical protein F9278_32330 [Streptomyces phaeolivaceus]|uniref:Uncharacterized protein n=1 Tax=Streptomyces phaeolivaceus TaxID=2653200 RepID=A0A5P8KIW1_9ACTN|nr:hypothetical protein F9278_32330 [Streptomyces phaeolivaceus]